MNKRLHLFIFFILLSFLLNSCMPTPRTADIRDSTFFLGPTYPQSVESYIQEAQNNIGPKKQEALLNAAGRLLYEKQTARAEQILQEVAAQPLQAAQHINLLLLQGQLAIAQANPTSALPILAKIENPDALSAIQQRHYHGLLAQAYALNGEVIHSVSQRIKLDHLLPNEKAQAINDQLIWQTIKEAPASALHMEEGEYSDPELKGWIRLADVNQRYNNQPEQLMAQLNTWQKQFPGHPGNIVLKGGTTNNSVVGTKPQQIALLLPLSGRLATSGKAVRDGVMAAHFAAQQEKNPLVNIRFYDTNKSNDITHVYQQAVSDGANFVIGPLTKPEVATLTQHSFSVPTVALNYAYTGTNTSDNFYQFGISPLDEAQAVAEKASRDGHHQAIIIAPQSNWGKEVTDAFVNRWQSLGGKITAQIPYSPKENLNLVIKQFFVVYDNSSSKIQSKKIRFVPRHHDADVIFLLADPVSARQILPLLKFYYAGDLQVYSTSFIYSGITQAQHDRDLNDVIFCDAPWVLNINNQTNNPYSRLYALGKDAYHLVYQLPRLILYPQLQVTAATGKLSLEPQHTLKRELAWAKFKDGIPQPLS